MGIWSLWLFVGAGFLIAELLTLSTTCLYVGLGALIAMCAAFLGGDWLATIITFVASTTLLSVTTFRGRHRLVRIRMV
ncbi:MAG: hypothetical protein K2G29_02365 [Muribaculaceae bacterium]|nr:hypothetical protein [Muribaculaceae bacterium]